MLLADLFDAEMESDEEEKNTLTSSPSNKENEAENKANNNTESAVMLTNTI